MRGGGFFGGGGDLKKGGLLVGSMAGGFGGYVARCRVVEAGVLN